MNNAKLILSILIFLVLNTSIICQHEIRFSIDNYESDTLVIGNYIMDKQLVYDTLYAEEVGQFILKDTLETGVYLMLTLPDKQFLQFLVTDLDRKFTMFSDYINKSKISYEGSVDNQNFQSYVSLINTIRPVADSLREIISANKESGINYKNEELQLADLNKNIANYQDSLINAFPDFLSTVLIKSGREIELPIFDSTEEGRMAQFRYYKTHYFDNIDLGDPKLLRTPFLFQRVTYYLEKLTANHPDSISVGLDSILNWMAPSQETYMYYLSHYLNKYAQAKIVGYDAVYVHLAENYYGKGKATWAQEETILKILDRAKKLKPVLLGQIGEDIRVFDEEGNAISISDIDYEYLILLFWAPDCGHCKKSMPGFIEFNEKYKDKGIKTFAICTKYRDKVKGCWEYVKEKNMSGFINGADEFNQSDFKLKYNVDSTPKLYILDKNREIIMKNIGADQLERVFEELIKIKSEEKESSDQ